MGSHSQLERESVMHADIGKMLTPPCACKFKTKKIITIKPNIQIKFKLHHYLSYDKIFKIRPHLPMFARYF